LDQLWFRSALLADGWADHVRLTLQDGTIAAVEAGVAPAPGDERGGAALPGLPNLHSHAFQRALAGRAERRGPGGDDFWSWRTGMYRLAERVGPEDLEAIAGMAYAEMLEAGFTRVGEFHYVHHDRDGVPYTEPAEMAAAIAAAADATGIGLTLLPVFYAQSGFGGLPPTPGQRRFITSPQTYARLLEASRGAVAPLPDAVVGIAPHSLRAVTPESLAEVLALAPKGPVHIHIAEQTKEVDDCLAWSGSRPVQWLYDRFEVDGRWCLVHATHVDSRELSLIAMSQAVAGLCPITEANLGDGVFPARDFLDLNGAFGVGSDSNVLIDPAEELRLLEYGQRLTARRRNVLAGADGDTGWTLWRGAWMGASRALGVEPEVIGEGAPATFISLDPGHPALLDAPADELIPRWLFAARAPAVDGVWRLGRKLVSGGRHVARDEIVRDYRETLARLSG
jgi:formimidoylglutamate deiminase